MTQIVGSTEKTNGNGINKNFVLLDISGRWTAGILNLEEIMLLIQ